MKLKKGFSFWQVKGGKVHILFGNHGHYICGVWDCIAYHNDPDIKIRPHNVKPEMICKHCLRAYRAMIVRKRKKEL